MDNKQDDFQERMNTMKAYDFREGKQQIQKGKIFRALSRITKNKYNQMRHYYEMVLFCKSFKGIMESAIIMKNFKFLVRENYMRNLITVYFDQFKNYSNIQKQQSNEKINQIQILRKKISIQHIRTSVAKTLARKKQIRMQTPTKNLQNEQKYKTEDNFFRQKSPNSRMYQKTDFRGYQVDQDPKKIINQIQPKRKFIAIKKLPEIPIGLVLKQTNQTDIRTKDNNKVDIVIQNNDVKSVKVPQCQISIQPTILPEETKKQAIQQKKEKSIPDPNKVISLLCSIKMAQVMQLGIIIQEFEANLKGQSTLNEKGYRNQSLKMIQDIINLN